MSISRRLFHSPDTVALCWPEPITGRRDGMDPLDAGKEVCGRIGKTGPIHDSHAHCMGNFSKYWGCRGAREIFPPKNTIRICSFDV